MIEWKKKIKTITYEHRTPNVQTIRTYRNQLLIKNRPKRMWFYNKLTVLKSFSITYSIVLYDSEFGDENGFRFVFDKLARSRDRDED